MKHMNPKDILSPRNLVGALLVAVTAAFLFAGTWMIYNEFVKADAPTVVYIASAMNAGGNSIFIIPAGMQLTTDGQIACPSLNPPINDGAICYATSGVTDLSGTSMAGGITTSNITALVRGGGYGTSKSDLVARFNSSNVLTNTNDASITINGLGGLPSPLTITTFAVPQPSVIYRGGDPNFGGKSSFDVPLNNQLNETNSVGCPEGFPQGAICYASSGVTAFSGTSLAEGITTSNITTLVRATAYGGPDNHVYVVFNATNVLTDTSNVSITLNNFGGLPGPKTKNTFSAASQPQTVTYSSGEKNYGAATFISPALVPDTFTNASEAACPQGATYAGKTCFNVAGVTDLSGTSLKVDKTHVAAIVKNNDNKSVTVVMDAMNVLTNFNNVSITFNNFGGISQPNTITTCSTSQTNADYTATNNNFGGKSTVLVQVPWALDNSTNTIDCTTIGVTEQGAICYNGNGISITGNGVVQGTNAIGIVRGTHSQIGRGDMFALAILNISNAITDTNQASLSASNFGGFSNQANFTTFSTIEAQQPSGSLVYLPMSSQFNGQATLTSSTLSGVELTDQNAVACPQGEIYSGKVCYDTSMAIINGSSFRQGTAIQAVVKAIAPEGPSTTVDIVFTGPNVLTDFTDASVQIQNIGGMDPSNVTITTVVIPSKGVYTASNGNFNNKSTILVPFPKALDGSTQATDCAAKGINIQGAVCYTPANNVTLGGDGWAQGIATNNVSVIVRGEVTPISAGDMFGLVVFDTANVASNIQNVNINIANIGAVSAQGVTTSQFNVAQQQQAASEYNNPDYAFGSATASIIVTFPQQLDNSTNVITCNEAVTVGLDSSPICYNTNTATLTAGFAEGASVLAIVRGDFLKNDTNLTQNDAIVIFSGTNLASGPTSSMQLSFSNIGGVNSASCNNIQRIAPVEAFYKQSSSTYGNKTTITTSPLTGGQVPNTTGVTVACPQGDAYTSKTCLNTNLVSLSGGQLVEGTSITAVVVGPQNNQLTVVLSTSTAVTNKSGMSLTVNTFGDIVAQHVFNNLVESQADPQPEQASYATRDPMIAGTSTFGFTYATSLSTGEENGVVTCDPAIVSIIPNPGETITCYNKTLVTNISGTSWMKGVTTADVWTLLRGDSMDGGSSSQLIVVFNKGDILVDKNNISITLGGLGGQPGKTVTSLTGDITAPTAIGTNDQVFMQMITPPPYTNVGQNLRTIQVAFSGPLNEATVNTNNITLKNPLNQSIGITTKLTSLYDNSNIITISIPKSTLQDNTKYTLELKNLQAANGTTLGNFTFDYTTKSSINDNTAPTVTWTSTQNGSANVDTMIWDTIIQFSESLTTPANTGTGCVVSPSVSSAVCNYDPKDNSLHILYNKALQASTEYTISLISKTEGGVKITNQAGYGWEDQSGNTINNYSLSFTTGSANATTPQLTWAEFTPEYAKVGYSTPLNTAASTVTNWTLSCDGTPISLTGGIPIENNTSEWFIKFYNPGISQSATECTLTAGANILAGNGQDFENGDDTIIANVTSSFAYYNEGENWSFGGCVYNCNADNRWKDPMMIMMGGIEFDPNTKFAGQESDQIFVRFPVIQSMTTGDKIEIEIPYGGSVNTNHLEVFAQDANGSDGATLNSTYHPEGQVTFSAIAYSAATQKITMTIAVDADGNGSSDAGTISNTSLEFGIAGFVNPSTATTYSGETNTGGSYATITTKNALGQQLEPIGQSSHYSVIEAGSGSISGTVTNAETSEGVGSLIVRAQGNNLGELTATTSENGAYSFSNLPNGNYFVFVETDKNATYVLTGTDNEIFIEDENLEHTGVDFKVNTPTKTIRVTFDLAGLNVSNSDIVIEGNGVNKPMHVEKKVTINFSQQQQTVDLPAIVGDWRVSLRTDFGEFDNMVNKVGDSNFKNTDFILPAGVDVSVTDAASIFPVALTMGSADATIKGTIRDSSGTAVAQAKIYAYRPDGQAGGSDATSTSDGTFSLKVTGGASYTLSAQVPGSSAHQEKNIFIGAAETKTGVDFSLNVPSILVTGSAQSNGDTVWVDASGPNGFFASTTADPQTGLYSLRVNANTTYTITASTYKGRLNASGNYIDPQNAEQNKVPVVGSNISSANFIFSATDLGKISGTVTPSISGITVCAESYSTTTFEPTGKYNCTGTTESGTYALQIKKNISGERFKVYAMSKEYGNMAPVNDIDIRSTNKTDANITAGTTQQVTVNIIGIPSGTTQMFFDMYQPTSYQGISLEIKNITNGSATKTFNIGEGAYKASIHIPGLGEILPDAGKDVTIGGASKTITFSLVNLSSQMKTINITVKDPSGNALANTWVEAFEPAQGTWIGGNTNNLGQISLTTRIVSSIDIRADNYQYSSKKITKTKAEITANNNVTITLGAQKTGTVSLVVSGASGKELWADISDSTGYWYGTPVNADGTATLYVPTDGHGMSLHINAMNGAHYEANNINAGNSVTVSFATFETPSDWISQETAKDPASQASTSNGLVLNDANNKVAISATAGNISSSTYIAQVKTVANTSSSTAFGLKPIISKEIKFYDESGNALTTLTGNYDLEITVTKEMMDAAKADGTYNSYDNLLTMVIGYWSSTTNSWVTESTTKYAYMKANSGSEWTAVELTTLVTNIKANASYYYDWKVTLKSVVNHATIFSPLTGSDATPPATPTGLSASATTLAVTLDWNDNAEGDLLEYEIYRNTSASVPIEDAYQINTSAVATSTYIDSTVTAGVKYYYAITAVDTSGNDSDASTTNITVPTGETITVVVTPPAETPTYGGGAHASSTSDEEEDDEKEELAGEPEEEGESGWESDEHETIAEEEGTQETVSEEEQETDYATHWAKTYIKKIIDTGIAQGLDEYTFEPDRDLARAEMTKMVVLAFGYDVPESISASTFPDVDTTQWYAPYVEVAYEHGLVGGYPDGTFQPTNNINRAEAMKIIVEAYLTDEEIDAINIVSLPFSDVDTTQWYAPYVTYAYMHDIVNGYSNGTYGTAKNITRAEFSKIIVNLLKL